jgi:hypothetical protein
LDYAALKAEVTSQPQYSAAYAARDVNAIQALYNAVTELGVIDMIGMDSYLKSNNVLPDDTIPAFWKIKCMAAGSIQPQSQLAQVVLDIFTSRLPGVDFALSAAISLMDQCVTAGVFSAQNKTDILALATKPRNISIQDLAFALYNPDGSVK